MVGVCRARIRCCRRCCFNVLNDDGEYAANRVMYCDWDPNARHGPIWACMCLNVWCVAIVASNIISWVCVGCQAVATIAVSNYINMRSMSCMSAKAFAVLRHVNRGGADIKGRSIGLCCNTALASPTKCVLSVVWNCTKHVCHLKVLSSFADELQTSICREYGSMLCLAERDSFEFGAPNSVSSIAYPI